LKDLVHFLASAMVDHPEPVSVNVHQEDERTVFQLSVHKNDLGKVIGKKGRTAKAMRTLLQAIASKTGQTVHLEIMDPVEPDPSPAPQNHDGA
jgi:predicted RNA-binding protein YlqC (UPF0109 family)